MDEQFKKFVALVKDMRAAQKAFHKSERGSDKWTENLDDSRRLERETDKMIERIEQPDLFSAAKNRQNTCADIKPFPPASPCREIESGKIQSLNVREIGENHFVDEFGNKFMIVKPADIKHPENRGLTAGKIFVDDVYSSIDFGYPCQHYTAKQLTCCCTDLKPNDCCPEHGNLSGHCINSNCRNFSKDEES